MKSIILIWLTINVFAIKAQHFNNLVIDSSFEKYDFLPETQYINKINKMLPYWFQPTAGTPDFFHTESEYKTFALPYSTYFNSFQKNNCINYQMPKTGNGIGGFIVSNVYDTIRKHKNYFEFVQTKLSNNLNKNHQYWVRFYVNRDHCSSMAVSNLGAYLSKDSIRNYNGRDSLDFTNFKEKIIPQIYNKDLNVIEDTVNWTSISGIYKAKGNEQWLTLGRFNDLIYNEIVYDTFNQFNIYFSSSSYYYIDDVSVTEIPSVIYDDTVCKGQIATITSTFKGPFKWLKNNALVSTDSIYSFKAMENTNFVLHSFNRKDTFNIIVKTDAYFNLGSDTFICAGSSFNINIPLKNATFKWQNGSTDSIYEIKRGGAYSLQVNKNNCSYSDTIYVEQRYKPSFNYSYVEVCNNDSVLKIFQFDKAYDYWWSKTQDNHNPKTIIQKGCQAVSVISSNQCQLDTQFCVSELCEPVLWVPNAFTPNGLNPLFQCKGINIGSLNVSIYNRWGEKIKELTYLDDSWDGKYKNKDCESELYLLIIQYTGINSQVVYKKKEMLHLLR
jgi:gliding motility-associated-like protein